MVLWQHVVLCKGTLLRMRLTIGVCSVLRCERFYKMHGATIRMKNDIVPSHTHF